MIPKEQHVAPSCLRCASQVCGKPNVSFRLPAKYNYAPEIVSVAHFANDFGRGNEVVTILRVAHEHKFIAQNSVCTTAGKICPSALIISRSNPSVSIFRKSIDLGTSPDLTRDSMVRTGTSTVSVNDRLSQTKCGRNVLYSEGSSCGCSLDSDAT